MANFEEDRAIAVLNEALNLEVIAAPLPQSSEKKIKLADLIIDKARMARKAGENGQHVQTILRIAEMEPFPTKNETGKIDPDEYEYDEALREALEENIPIPPDIKGEPPILPENITELSDLQIMRLIGEFNACSARVNWLYAVETAGHDAAKLIADSKEDEYILSADRKDIGGKPKPAALLKAEAKADNPDILKWRKREKYHERRANKYKRLGDSYDLSCDRLSRAYTIKSDERKHS